MTIITKPLSEKKIDKLDQPLVAAECLVSPVSLKVGVAASSFAHHLMRHIK